MLGGIDIRVATTNATLRRDGAQAGPVRRRRHHRAPAPPARLPRGHGVPAHRRGLPRRAGARARACSTRSSSRGRAARPGPRLGGPHHRQRARSPCRPPRRASCAAWPPTLDEAYQIETELAQRCLRQRGRQGRPQGVRREAPAGLAGQVAAVARRPAGAVPHRRGPVRVAARATGRAPSRWRCGSEVVRDAARRRRGVGRRARARSTACRSSTARAGSTTTPPGRLAERARHRAGPPPLLGHRRHDPAGPGQRPRHGASSPATLDVGGRVRGRGPRHQAPAEEGGGAAGVVATATPTRRRSRSRRRSIPPRSPTRCSRRGSPSPLCDVGPAGPPRHRARRLPAGDRRAHGPDDRGGGGQPVRLVPGRARRPRSWSPRPPRTAWSATRTPSTRCRSWTSTWPAALVAGQPRGRRPPRRARRAAGLPARLGLRLPTPCTWPSTPSPGARRPWPRCTPPRWRGAGAGHRRPGPPRPLLAASRRRCTSPCDALGLDADDPRGVTVTGGLPFAGGAGSNYLTHAIAAMVDAPAGRSRLGRAWSPASACT